MITWLCNVQFIVLPLMKFQQFKLAFLFVFCFLLVKEGLVLYCDHTCTKSERFR